MPPVLLPEHFGEDTQAYLGDRGLELNVGFNADEYSTYAVFAGVCARRREAFEWLACRHPAWCVANPSADDPALLREHVDWDNRDFDFDSGLPDFYDVTWRQEFAGSDDGGWDTRESQRVLLVCIADDRAVGFANANVAVSRDLDPKKLSLCVDLSALYVAPRQRGRGYGVSLTLALAALVTDMYAAACSVSPPGWELSARIYAHYATKEGARAATWVHGARRTRTKKYTAA